MNSNSPGFGRAITKRFIQDAGYGFEVQEMSPDLIRIGFRISYIRVGSGSDSGRTI
jgi:hypothetical protein